MSGRSPPNGKPSNGQPPRGQPSRGRPSGGQPSGGQPSGGQPSRGKPFGNPAGGARRILAGIARLATGHADGFALFPATPQGFLASLAPLLAFPLVGTMLMLAAGAGSGALADLLATVCAVLAPAVLSHWLARRWGREEPWLRFITAFNWCQWVIPVAAMLVLAITGIGLRLGLSKDAGAVVAMALLGGYGVWLHYFLARRGLDFSPLRAVALVLVVNLGTVVLVLLPRALLMAGR